MRYKIEKFLPPAINKHKLEIEKLSSFFPYNLCYVSMGRYAFYHILKSLNVTGKVLIPAYLCGSLLEPLKMLRIEPVFYDLDLRDLNALVESIDLLTDKYQIQAVLVASMYGNPADLKTIEKLCLTKKILLIDDAAQSLGAILNEQYIGSFGNAGFFSCSPGKPVAGHMGAFFWTQNKNYHIARTEHTFFHYLSYLDFFFNRLYIYKTRPYLIFRLLGIMKKITNRFVDIKNDDLAKFEAEIIGGILHNCLRDSFYYRRHYTAKFITEFEHHSCFQIIKSIRGVPSNHKFVIVANNIVIAKKLIRYLFEKQIFCLNGYQLLTSQLSDLPNCREINGRVIELPIEDDEQKMSYLFEMLYQFKG